jgi:hypothetical protein
LWGFWRKTESGREESSLGHQCERLGFEPEQAHWIQRIQEAEIFKPQALDQDASARILASHEPLENSRDGLLRRNGEPDSLGPWCAPGIAPIDEAHLYFSSRFTQRLARRADKRLGDRWLEHSAIWTRRREGRNGVLLIVM